MSSDKHWQLLQVPLLLSAHKYFWALCSRRGTGQLLLDQAQGRTAGHSSISHIPVLVTRSTEAAKSNWQAFTWQSIFNTFINHLMLVEESGIWGQWSKSYLCHLQHSPAQASRISKKQWQSIFASFFSFIFLLTAVGHFCLQALHNTSQENPNMYYLKLHLVKTCKRLECNTP